jgi:hypothetical protein
VLRWQVTNPPIDPFREAFVTSTRIMIGPEHDMTQAPYSDRHARRVELAHPVLMPRELQAFRHLGYLVRKTMTLIYYPTPILGEALLRSIIHNEGDVSTWYNHVQFDSLRPTSESHFTPCRSRAL